MVPGHERSKIGPTLLNFNFGASIEESRDDTLNPRAWSVVRSDCGVRDPGLGVVALLSPVPAIAEDAAAIVDRHEIALVVEGR